MLRMLQLVLIMLFYRNLVFLHTLPIFYGGQKYCIVLLCSMYFMFFVLVYCLSKLCCCPVPPFPYDHFFLRNMNLESFRCIELVQSSLIVLLKSASVLLIIYSMETITLGDKRIGIKTSVLEEKATACNMLCCYADELKEGFYPWIDQVDIEKIYLFFII